MQIPRLLSSVTIFLTTSAFAARDIHLKIDAGNTPRHNAPITSILKITPQIAASATSTGVLKPSGIMVQIEHPKDASSQLILRWIEPHLQPAQTKEYDLEFTAVHGNLP